MKSSSVGKGRSAVVTDGWVDNLLRATIAVLIVTLIVLMAGCCPYSDHVSVDAIREPAKAVIQRHDIYVHGDPSLLDIERRIYLRTSEELNGVLDEAARGD